MIHQVAVRFDKTGNSNAKIFSQLLEDSALDVIEYIISEEVSKECKKIHYHAQVNINSHNQGKSVRKSVRLLCKAMGLKAHQLYVKGTKDLTKHLTYITKDLKIVISKWENKEILQKAQDITSRINEEKNTKMKHQLLDYAKQLGGEDDNAGFLTVENLVMEIIKYHVERDYLPPSRTLLTQYCGYIITKMYSSSTQRYKDMITELYKL